MTSICREIFRAIHEGKWLSIEYKNKEGQTTKYWIGIKTLNPFKKVMKVDGLHLSWHTVCELDIYIESILTASIVEGSYCEKNEQLIDDMKLNPSKYSCLFSNVINLKILNYLADCNRLDTTPYKCEYSLIQKLDRDCLSTGICRLNPEQFKEIVNNFQYKSTKKTEVKKVKQLCMNIMSIHTPKGLYVLAYRKLNLDVKNHTLKPVKEITVCREFTIDGEKQSVRQFLDADDYYLLEDFEENQELIKDRITQNNWQISGVDDMPYVIAIGMDVILDLNHEYASIIDAYNKDQVTTPIRAFFGELLKRPDRRKQYPIALLNQKVNLDQLLAINNAVKYPLTYVQGPPGTGKTTTIINTIITAFFNERSVLFASYNNHPIDSVFETLTEISHKNNIIPFPVIRLGNNEKVAEALDYMKKLYERTEPLTIYDKTLNRNRDDKIENTKQLTELLKKHEEILDLRERRETIEKLSESTGHMAIGGQFQFKADLDGRQLDAINRRLNEIGEVTTEEALKLLTNDEKEFKKYLYYTSAKYIKRLGEPKNKNLLDIIYLEDKEMRVKEFNEYLKKEENVKKFLRIFPIVTTTCISAHKIGEPKPYFDMVILDEASQCSTAVSLVPVIRGENLMLVGDPQQLNPVILLDPKDNLALKKRYAITDEYDYIANSIYKTFLACDTVSDEILLRYHYRCHKKIIDFNNRKYYNSKLEIRSSSAALQPLVYKDIENNDTDYKNTAPAEARQAVTFAAKNPEKKIGVITPFVNQKEYINTLAKAEGLGNLACGTVHAFQGDEKDVILFSLAITDKTHKTTYDWLKNNKELINVATSRAKDQLIVLSSSKNLKRLHDPDSQDDIFELVEYVKTNGTSEVTGKEVSSRALGVKPYSTETEEAFLRNLNHAIDNIELWGGRCKIQKEVSIAHVFNGCKVPNDLFYTGRFDFVVYEKVGREQEVPRLAIELDGKEHQEDEIVKRRDEMKNEICQEHNFVLIRVENSYARRYQHMKDILIKYFEKLNS